MLLDPGTIHPFLGAGRAQVQEGAWELRCWVSREHLVACNPGPGGALRSVYGITWHERWQPVGQSTAKVVCHLSCLLIPLATRRAPEPRAMLLVVWKNVRDLLTRCRAALWTPRAMPSAQAYALLPPPWNTGCHVGLLVTCFAFLHGSLWWWGGWPAVWIVVFFMNRIGVRVWNVPLVKKVWWFHASGLSRHGGPMVRGGEMI